MKLKQQMLRLLSRVLHQEERLYRKTGVSLSLRNKAVARQSKKIQDALDRQHYIKDWINEVYQKNFTTKKAMTHIELTKKCYICESSLT